MCEMSKTSYNLGRREYVVVRMMTCTIRI